MPSKELQIVSEAFLPIFGAVDMVAAIDDDVLWEPTEGLVNREAEIRFITTDGGGMGAMGGPFRGLEGMQAGWREWLGPWQTYEIATEEVVEASEGRVVALVHSRGQMRGSGAEITQDSAAVVRVEAGEIVAVDFYLDQDQGRREAGIT